MKWVRLLFRVGLGLMFLYAGLVKAGASEGFAVTIANFTILPLQTVAAFAVSLPWIEILCGILLLIPHTAKAGAILAALLLALFSTALIWALAQDLIVDCGCFGNDGTPSRGKMVFTLARDLVLLAMTLALGLTRRR